MPHLQWHHAAKRLDARIQVLLRSQVPRRQPLHSDRSGICLQCARQLAPAFCQPDPVNDRVNDPLLLLPWYRRRSELQRHINQDGIDSSWLGVTKNMSDEKRAVNTKKWADKMSKPWVGSPMPVPVSFGCNTLAGLRKITALGSLQFPLASCGCTTVQGMVKISERTTASYSPSSLLYLLRDSAFAQVDSQDPAATSKQRSHDTTEHCADQANGKRQTPFLGQQTENDACC